MKEVSILELLKQEKLFLPLNETQEKENINKICINKVNNFSLSAELYLEFSCYSIVALAQLKRGDLIECNEPRVILETKDQKNYKQFKFKKLENSRLLQTELER